MYYISLEEHKLAVGYTILKFSRTILKEIYIESAGEGKLLYFFKQYHKIKAWHLPDSGHFP